MCTLRKRTRISYEFLIQPHFHRKRRSRFHFICMRPERESCVFVISLSQPLPCGAFRILIPLRLPDFPLSRVIVHALRETGTCPGDLLLKQALRWCVWIMASLSGILCRGLLPPHPSRMNVAAPEGRPGGDSVTVHHPIKELSYY